MSPLANIKWREQVEISCGINKYPPQHHIGGKTNKQFSWKNGNSPVIQTPQHMHFFGGDVEPWSHTWIYYCCWPHNPRGCLTCGRLECVVVSSSSLLFWLLDLTNLCCNPYNLIQHLRGHLLESSCKHKIIIIGLSCDGVTCAIHTHLPPSFFFLFFFFGFFFHILGRFENLSHVLLTYWSEVHFRNPWESVSPLNNLFLTTQNPIWSNSHSFNLEGLFETGFPQPH